MSAGLRVAIDARAIDLSYLREHGIGRYSTALLHALGPVCAEREGELIVLRSSTMSSASSSPPGGTIPNARVLRLRRPPLPERLAVLPEQLLLPLDLRRAKAQALHATSIFRIAFAPGVPSLVTIHDVIPLLFPRDYLRSGLLYRFLFAAARRATLIQTVSEHARADIVSQLGVARERIEVVPGAADERFRPTDPGGIPARLGISSPYVLYVGAMTRPDPRKGLEALIDAFAAWAQDRGRTETLVLAGRVGPAASAARGIAQRTGARVVFTDFVPDCDLPALYSGAGCLVTASRYEGFGLPALEALACGTPVAAYAAGALPEVAGPGALLVRDGDSRALMGAVERLLDDPQLRMRLAQSGREHAGRYSWRRSAELAWEAYERAVRDAAPTS